MCPVFDDKGSSITELFLNFKKVDKKTSVFLQRKISTPIVIPCVVCVTGLNVPVVLFLLHLHRGGGKLELLSLGSFPVTFDMGLLGTMSDENYR